MAEELWKGISVEGQSSAAARDGEFARDGAEGAEVGLGLVNADLRIEAWGTQYRDGLPS